MNSTPIRRLEIAVSARSLNVEILGAIALIAASMLFGAGLFFLADYFVLSHWLVDPDTVVAPSPMADPFDHFDHGWYMLKPNLNATMAWGPEVYPVRTDSSGFRVDDIAPRPDGPADFIFLGDSFTFGINGAWSKTFVGQFEHGSRRRVVNAGAASYSPTPYIYQYRRAIAAKLLKPHHAVVVALDLSDVQDEAAIWEDGGEHPQHRIEFEQGPRVAVDNGAPTAPQASSPPMPPREASHFIAWKLISRFVRPKVRAIFAAPKPDEPDPSVALAPLGAIRSAFTWRPWAEIDSEYRPLGVAGGIALIRQKMRVLADLVHQNGGELWLVIYPWPAQLVHGENVFDWEEFGKELCVEIACRELINTFPLFRAEASWYSKYFVVGDAHLNDRGNRLIADALLERVAGAAAARK
jgi:hypothetical protein